jgi:hypothetical protein
LKQALLLLSWASFMSGQVAGQDLRGDWQGTLAAGQAELRLVLHIQKGADGKFLGTIDSIDQGAEGIPVTVEQSGAKVKIVASSIQASFDSTLSADGKTLSGSWSQGAAAPLQLNRTDHPWSAKLTPAEPSDIDGRWQGTLNFAAGNLRFVIRFINTTDGLTAMVQSPDQSPDEMPATKVTRDNSKVTVEMKQFGAEFVGIINGDKTAIDGTFTQSGQAVPLHLTRAAQ